MCISLKRTNQEAEFMILSASVSPDLKALYKSVIIIIIIIIRTID